MAKKNKTNAKDESQQDLDEGTIATLIEMAAWWTEHKDELLQPLPLARPKFRRGKGKTTTRSIRLSKELVRLAEAKAKKEKARTGGNLNSLIELLIWEFLNRPRQLIETDSTEAEK